MLPRGNIPSWLNKQKRNVISTSRTERSPVINQAQFNGAEADNIKERLFTTASSRAQPSVHATRRENYKTRVGQIDVLDPQKIDHENSHFGEDEVKSLCGTFCLKKQQTQLAYNEFKASGGRKISDQLNVDGGR